jgi:hypothetical protein
VYTLTKRELTALRAKLTRAQRSGDPTKVIQVCKDAFKVFEDKGYPDCWHRWNIARHDAEMEVQYLEDPPWPQGYCQGCGDLLGTGPCYMCTSQDL